MNKLKLKILRKQIKINNHYSRNNNENTNPLYDVWCAYQDGRMRHRYSLYVLIDIHTLLRHYPVVQISILSSMDPISVHLFLRS